MILNSNCGTRGIINVEGLRMILICKSISTVNVNMKKKKKLGLSKTIQYLVILHRWAVLYVYNLCTENLSCFWWKIHVLIKWNYYWMSTFKFREDRRRHCLFSFTLLPISHTGLDAQKVFWGLKFCHGRGSKSNFCVMSIAITLIDREIPKKSPRNQTS